MSLLVDLLAKAKSEESRNDIPPDLRRKVVDGAFRKKTRRKIVLLCLVVLVVFLAGFAMVYLIEVYRTSLTTAIAKKPLAPKARERAVTSPITPEQSIGQRDQHVQPPTQPAMRDDKVTERIGPAAPATPKSKSSEEMLSSPVHEGDRVARPEMKTPGSINNPRRDTSKMEGKESPKAETVSGGTSEKDVYLHAARTHESMNEYSRALADYEKALELDPANYVVMNNAAGVLIRLKFLEESLRYSKKALSVRADYVPALVNAGIAYVSLGNYSEGEQSLSKALSIAPSDRSALFNLGVLYEGQGQEDKAYQCYFQLSQARDLRGFLGPPALWKSRAKTSKRCVSTETFYRWMIQHLRSRNLPMNG